MVYIYMTTFIIPDYTIGNSADCQVQAIGVLQGLDQALQSLQPAPNATTVQFNDTLLLDNGTTATNTIDNTGVIITETAGVFGVKTNTINKIGYEVREDDGLGHYQEVELQQDNLSFFFNQPSLGYDFDMGLYATTGGGLCGIQHIDRSSTIPSNLTLSTNQNLVLTADNIDLSTAGRLVLPSLASADYLDYNAGTLTLKSANVGYTTDELLLLENTNVSAGTTNGVPSIEMYKSGRNGATADIIASIQFNAKDGAGLKRTFGKIESSITTNIAPNNYDGALDFYTLVNGSNNNVFRLNGQDNENNTFRPFDLNGNLLKTSQGNLILDATASAGTGDIDIFAKVGGVVNINSNVVMDNSESFVQRNPAFTIYNNQTTTSISLVDNSTGGIVNENINSNISQILTNDTSLATLTNESYCNLQKINKFDNTLSVDVETTEIRSSNITINEFLNPNTEQVDIYPTYIQFTSSGSASDSLSMYNDSADGGEINWSNTTGTNGLTITSSHSLNLISTASTFPIELDSDVINLKNTNTTTSVSNHNADIRSTSTGLETTTFLKLQLNGADIWIPYFTTDPSI